jgi:hypothetical protein
MSDQRNDVSGDLNAPQAEVQPSHVPFSWLHTDKGGRSARFIETVLDVCGGLQTCLELVHATDLALHARSMDDDEAVPVLGIGSKERLLRLAIAATGMLSNRAYEEIDWINEQARQSAERGRA